MSWNEYSFNPPIFPALRRCHYCGRKLSKGRRDGIVRKTSYWGYDLPHERPDYYCDRYCARAEVLEKRVFERLSEQETATLKEFIEGVENERD